MVRSKAPVSVESLTVTPFNSLMCVSAVVKSKVVTEVSISPSSAAVPTRLLPVIVNVLAVTFRAAALESVIAPSVSMVTSPSFALMAPIAISPA